jgi:hypothetical protein
LRRPKRIGGNGKMSLRKPKHSTRKFSNWKKKKKNKKKKKKKKKKKEEGNICVNTELFMFSAQVYKQTWKLWYLKPKCTGGAIPQATGKVLICSTLNCLTGNAVTLTKLNWSTGKNCECVGPESSCCLSDRPNSLRWYKTN